MNPRVSLLFHPDPPQRYTARIGDGGWLEGHGFTVEEALRDLAEAVASQGRPKPALGRLRRAAGTPVLAD